MFGIIFIFSLKCKGASYSIWLLLAGMIASALNRKETRALVTSTVFNWAILCLMGDFRQPRLRRLVLHTYYYPGTRVVRPRA